ncbi:MAG: DMT family transporter [Synechococcus sp. SB0662_bin_14]|nr:DMT family transporter [Synechococcus sp. SB0662_bin_14]
MEINRRMTVGEWGLLFSLSVLWGGSFFFNGVAVRQLPTFTIVVARVAMAAVLLWGVVLLGQRRPIPQGWRLWRAFLVMGLLNNAVPFSLIVWGQSQISSGVASILNAATPLLTVVVAHGVTADEKMTPARLMGVLLGMAGVVVVIGADALASLGVQTVAQLACLAAALSYAFAGVFGRRFRAMGVSPLVTAAGQVTASSVILVPVMLVVDRPWQMAGPGLAAILACVGLAVLSTALAYVIYFRVLATAGATNLLLVTLLVPVSAVLLGVVVLQETLLPNHLMGTALIGLGLATIDGRPLQAVRTAMIGNRQQTRLR